jgi:hypothetical protein
MTFTELDQRIRNQVDDPIERKVILQGLHEIEESMNQCAAFWLSVTGYTVDEEKIYRKNERSTLFQINN